MPVLTTPESNFTLLDEDIYDARIREVDVTTFTEQNPSPFKKTSGHSLTFKFDVFVPDQDEPEDRWRFIGLATGEKAALTKLTRALKMDDLVSGDAVDTDDFIGKELRVNIAHQVRDDGTTRDRIDSFLPKKKSAKPVPTAIAKPRPKTVAEEENEDEAF